MTSTARRSLLLLLVTVPLAMAGCRSRALDIPGFGADTSSPETPPVQLPPSYVSAPIAFNLHPLLAELEAELPRKFGSLDRKQAVKIKLNNAPDLELAPEITRGPLAIEFKDNTVTVESVNAYKARAWTGVLFSHSVSCGTGDAIPRMKLAIRVRPSISWKSSFIRGRKN